MPSRHPRGLALLFFTEMWERFSYYGMRALLLLYLADAASGMALPRPTAARIYGWYAGLVWLTPIAGGWLADRALGAHRALVLGGAAIALGHFSLTLHHGATFFAGLALIVLGTGLFKPTVSTMVGRLYAPNDPRRDAGFTIFYMGIDIGAFAGPLVTGWLAAQYGWHVAFAAAGVGMTLGLAVYVIGTRHSALGTREHLRERDLEPRAVAECRVPSAESRNRRIAAIVLAALFAVVFWIGNEQAGSSLNLFALERVDRAVGGWVGGLLPRGEIPVAWFQSVAPLCVIGLAPLISALWTRLGARQPGSVAKMALGLLFLGAGFAVMIAAARRGAGGALVSPLWLVGCYVLLSCGEICQYPVYLSFVARTAPPRRAAAMMGTAFLALFAANVLGGYLAAEIPAIARGAYGRVLGGEADYFLLFVVAGVASGLLLLALRPVMRRLTAS